MLIPPGAVPSLISMNLRPPPAPSANPLDLVAPWTLMTYFTLVCAVAIIAGWLAWWLCRFDHWVHGHLARAAAVITMNSLSLPAPACSRMNDIVAISKSCGVEPSGMQNFAPFASSTAFTVASMYPAQ